MSELEKQIEKETGVRVVRDDYLEWSVYHPKGSDCVLETDAVVILWQALLSARKRIENHVIREDKMDAENGKLQQRIAELEAELEELKDRLNEFIAPAEVGGGTGNFIAEFLELRKRIAELEATFPSEEEIECQAHMTRDSVGGIAGFLACADWLRERLGVK